MLHVPDNTYNALVTATTTATVAGPYVLALARLAYAETTQAAGSVAEVAPSLDQVLTSGPLLGSLVVLYLLAGKIQQAIETLTRWKPVVEIVHHYPQRRPPEGDDEITGVRTRLRTEERDRE
jgi:hypothetical protein